MQVIRNVTILLCLILAPLLAMAGDAEHDFRQANDSFRQLLDSPRKQYRDQWLRVIDRFTAVADRYPSHRLAAKSLFAAGKAAQGLHGVSRRPQDAALAAGIFDAVAARFPTNSLMDDALVRAAGIYEKNLKDPAKAALRYRQAADAQPPGDQALPAKKKVEELARFLPPAPQAVEASVKEPVSAPVAAAPPTPEGKRGRHELTSIRFWSNPGYTRIVLDLSGPAEFAAHFIPGDPAVGQVPRLYVDIRGTVPGVGIAESTRVEDGLLQQIRTGRYDSETVRVVLDLVSFGEYKIFPLEDPHRLILDVTGDRLPELSADQPSLTVPAPAGETVGPVERKAEDRREKVPPPPPPLLRRIVVDAGHGGKDPGAIGPTGIMEKDVTLAIAKVVAKKLKKEFACDVILTRSGDVFLPLEERTAIANRVGADLFLSIHANASTNREAYGIETYYLNFSKNDQAAAVAARENGTSLKKVGDLELILFDLMANSKINESSRLAAEIQRALVEDLGRHFTLVKDLGVRQGPFYVLLGANMPSVLVETAFISHAREEHRLADRRYHERSAEAIVRAVRTYAESQRMLATQ